MPRQYRFRTLFFRQWLNSIGIPLVGATLLLILYPKLITLLLLVIAVAAFLIVAYFGRSEAVRERSVALMLASVGVAVAILCFFSAARSVKKAEEYLGKEAEAVGFVTRSEEGSADLSLVTLNGKKVSKKIRLQTKGALPYGAKIHAVFLPTDARDQEALEDGVFFIADLNTWEAEGKSLVLSSIGSLRNTFLTKLGEGRESSFLKAILLGDRDGLEKEDDAAFRKTASSHLLAISGLHITVLAGIAYCMMDFLFMPTPGKKAILFPVIIFLYLITGGAVSVFRASFMALFGASAFFFNQQSDSVTSLVLAASLILMQNPFAVTDLSFLFSFVSTFAIVTLASPFCAAVAESLEPYCYEKGKLRLYSVAAYVTSGALISASVFLFSLPLNLLIFGEIQILSPIFSAILIPLFSPLLFLGVGFLVFLLLPFSVPFVTEAVYFVIRLFLDLLRLLSAAAPPVITFGNYNVPVALFVMALLGVFMHFRCKIRSFLLLYVISTAAMLPMLLFV